MEVILTSSEACAVHWSDMSGLHPWNEDGHWRFVLHCSANERTQWLIVSGC